MRVRIPPALLTFTAGNAMAEPTKEEIRIARKVLKHFFSQANKLAEHTNQERPSEWARGLEIVYGLLHGGAKETMDDYLTEYEFGR